MKNEKSISSEDKWKKIFSFLISIKTHSHTVYQYHNFNNTLKLVEEADITKLHVFPYSERPGTPASKMPQVPVNIRRKRAEIVRNLRKETE